MNRERFKALFFILLGIAMIGGSVWAMFDWSNAYEAAHDHTAIVLRAIASNTTAPVFQTDPPFDGNLFGILVPVIYTAAGTCFLLFGIYYLNKAP